MTDIEIQTDKITLEQLLKFSGYVSTGGQAKILIQSGKVRVNGQIETRRGRKLVPGDIVDLGDELKIFRVTRH
ncbi:MAG TPA: RNA-binding S4 domain-containing protein [Firmicutes bacterium]|nr:RNA-binding S4 domain-containing protein [Bacillota bacterium]HHY97376.1 RNA-binding S4 domain-containing protein [Bacillota bacterium]